MSEQNNAANQVQGEEAEAPGCPAKVFATKEEAKSAWTPPSPTKGKNKGGESKYKVFDVVQADAVIGYVWGRGYNDALARWAKAVHSVKASYTNGSAHAPSKETAKNVVLEFTDEEWAALVKARTQGATPTQAVQAAQGKGKGKSGK